VLRSILVALDATPASAAAQRLAIELARRCDCQITGLAILDRDHITAPTAVGIGGMAYKQHRDRVKLEEAAAFLRQLQQAFQKSCEEAGALWQVIEGEGEPYRLIERESGRHDLMVIGKDTDFHFEFDPSTTETVERLLHDNPRPLIVCPEHAPADGNVLVAYDGTLQSSRALHMFALLEHAKSQPVHILSVASDQAEAQRMASYGAELLTKHGFNVTAHGIASSATPSDIILSECQTLDASLIAMGAFGQRTWKEFFLGSTTKRLMDRCPCPLFVHH
jgi:nucleotide-binding universal stress UspA family protein